MAKLIKAGFIHIHLLSLPKVGLKRSILDVEKIKFLYLRSRGFPNGSIWQATKWGRATEAEHQHIKLVLTTSRNKGMVAISWNRQHRTICS